MMKKVFLFVFMFFIGMSITEAKTIRTCTYNSDPDSYDGTKYIIKINHEYKYTFYIYTYNHPTFSYNPGVEKKLLNWDDNIKKGIETKEKCPPYLVNSPKHFWSDDMYYVYFNKEKAEKRKKDASLWLGSLVKITEDKDLREHTDGKTDLEDKKDGESSVDNNENEDIREYKRTYPLGTMSNDLSGREFIFYTKYNLTKKQSLSTQLTIEGDERPVGLIYPGSIADFSQNIIEPIVNDNKWPENFFCGEITSYLMVNPNANVTVILGTANTGDLVCSPDKNAFVDGTNKLTSFTTKEEDKNKGNLGDQLDEPEKIEGVDKLTDACNIIDKDSGFFKILKQIIGYIQIGTIFLVLILGVLDLTGAVGSQKDDALKKAASKFGKRMIAAALIFLVPAMLNIIFNVINISSCGVADDKSLISELFK